MTPYLQDSGRTQTGRLENLGRFIRLGATATALALLSACGGSDPPETNVPNSAPVASAGPDQTVFSQAQVNLSGSASTDADGDNLAYSWEFESRPAGSAAALVDAGTVTPTFTPDVPGTYSVSLTVNDGFEGGTGADSVTVTAGVPPPVASAGADQNISFAAPGVTVQLNGSASSDPSGLPLTYAWEIQSFVPASGLPPASSVTLVNGNTPNASFAVTQDDQLGIYTLRLTVNNGTSASSDQVLATIASIPAPVAAAGPDQDVLFVVDGTTVNLDGTGSSDPSSLPLTYAWQILSFQSASGDPPAAGVILIGAATPTPTFDVTALDQLGTYTIQLTVSNGTLASTDQVVVTVAKAFPAAGALLGGGLFASAGAVLRRRWRQWNSARQGRRP